MNSLICCQIIQLEYFNYSRKKRNDITVYFYGKDISKRRRRSVADVEINDEYARINHDNNLAIVTLAVPLDLEKMGTSTIAPICIINPFLFTGRLNKIKGLMIKRQDHKIGMYFFRKESR